MHIDIIYLYMLSVIFKHRSTEIINCMPIINVMDFLICFSLPFYVAYRSQIDAFICRIDTQELLDEFLMKVIILRPFPEKCQKQINFIAGKVNEWKSFISKSLTAVQFSRTSMQAIRSVRPN